MSPVIRAAACLVALLALAAGCALGDDASADALPEYCAASGDGDAAEFWTIVQQSCRVAGDGDREQARALRGVLDELDADEVAAFHTTFVELNHALDTDELYAVTARICGLTLGDDSSTEYRSWIVAHGQDAYEAVLEDPATVRRFPDRVAGCGSGQTYGEVAPAVYAEQGGDPADLPVVEVHADHR